MSVAPLIDKEYVATGKVRVVYRNRAVIGDESVLAAESALCAGDQGKFWQYHDKLYDSWKGENVGSFSKDNLRRFASELGLDTQAFNACLDGNKYYGRVNDETAESSRRGVRATPTFFVGDVMVQGAQPFDAFKKVIDAELQRQQ